MQKGEHNHLIDLLRFLSASCVVLFHLNEPIPYLNNWYRNLCKLGSLGVPVFFIISGYCICIALQHAKTPKEFLIRRFFRIFPPYWFSLILVAVCVLILKLITGYNFVAVLPKTPGAIICTLILIPKEISNYSYINWVYWTLPYEICFYLIVYLISFLPALFRMVAVIIITSIAVVLSGHVPAILFFMKELPTFMLGYALYNLLQSDHKHIGLSLVLFVLSAIGMVVTHTALTHPIVALLVTICILWNNYHPLKANKLSSYGDFSYAIYLIHVPLVCYLLGFIKDMPIVKNNVILNIIADFSLLAIVVLLSMLMYKKIELPAIRLGKKLTTAKAVKNTNA